MIDFGKRVRDGISGFTGKVTGRAEYIGNRWEYLVQPECKSNDELPPSIWFPDNRIEELNSKKKKAGF